MGILKEFESFAKRGNVLDVAVGVTMAGAFGKIVSSMVADIIMPPIGIILGKVNFNNLFIALDGKQYETMEAAKKAGVSVINFGGFVNNTVDFIIIAFVLFLVMRTYNKYLRRTEPKVVTTKLCPYCCTNISIDATRCPNCTSELKDDNKDNN